MSPGELSAEPFGLARRSSDAAGHQGDDIESLASQFLDALRAGHAPSIEEYVHRAPAQADDIRRLFPMIAAMEDWKDGRVQRCAWRTIPESLAVERLGECRILREVGRGGMGIVFEAVQESLGRRVAVKLLPWQYPPDSPQREQFVHEARIAASLRHPNIVPVYGFGEWDGYCYYVMPFIPGVSLDWIIGRLNDRSGVVLADEIGSGGDAQSLLGRGAPARRASAASRSSRRSRRQLSRNAWGKITKIGVQVSSALRYAHRQGLLHRDIKPSNLLLDADGVVWITDFGLAIPTSHAAEHQQLAGTLRYMAPEQFAGMSDERSDIYSLGITLYELCTLQPAHCGQNRRELREAIQQGLVTSPQAVNPEIPAALAAILQRAVAVAPSARYQTADELTTDLLRFLSGRRVFAPGNGAKPPDPSQTGRSTDVRAKPGATRRSGRRGKPGG